MTGISGNTAPPVMVSRGYARMVGCSPDLIIVLILKPSVYAADELSIVQFSPA